MIFPMKPVSRKRLEHIIKNRNTEKYRKWRDAVLERDERKCQFPGCARPEVTKLEIHHIQTFAKNPHLKTAVFNGITLCQDCHQKIKSREQQFAMVFFKIVKANSARQRNKDNL